MPFRFPTSNEKSGPGNTCLVSAWHSLSELNSGSLLVEERDSTNICHVCLPPLVWMV